MDIQLVRWTDVFNWLSLFSVWVDHFSILLSSDSVWVDRGQQLVHHHGNFKFAVFYQSRSRSHTLIDRWHCLTSAAAAVTAFQEGVTSMTSHWSRLYFMTFYIVTMVTTLRVSFMSVQVFSWFLSSSVCPCFVCTLSRWWWPSLWRSSLTRLCSAWTTAARTGNNRRIQKVGPRWSFSPMLSRYMCYRLGLGQCW